MTHDARRRIRRVLLIGLDGADWAVLRPLMQAGRLPILNRLVEAGLSGTMMPLLPTHAAPLWTSLVTGKRAYRHGVYVGVVPAVGGVRPVGPGDRAAHPIWTILASRNLRSHAIAWPAVHASEPINGVCVSERFVCGVELDTRTTSDVSEKFRALRLLPEQVQAATLRELVGDAAMARSAVGDPRLRACAGLLARAVTTHNIVTHLAAQQDWDLMAVHYAAIGQASRLFMAHRPSALVSISIEEADAFGGVVDAVCQFQDMLLGCLLELAGEETAVVLVSGHGFATGAGRPSIPFSDLSEAEAAWHRGGGVCVLAGSPFKADELIEGVSPLEIAPTILTLLGVPVGGDMDGRPLLRAFHQPLHAPSIPSWEAELPLSAEAAVASDAAWDAAAPLIAEGFADPLAEQTPEGAEAYLLAMLHRAQSLLGDGQAPRARPLLQRLVAARPRRAQYRLDLFNATMACSDFAAARQELQDAIDAGFGGALIDLGQATVDLAEHRPLSALAALQRIDLSRCRVSDVFVLKGEALLRLGRQSDAAIAFAAALESDTGNEKAWLGQARTLRGLGDNVAAAEAVRNAIARRPDFAPAHLELAVQRRRDKNLSGARESLLRALSIDPHLEPARKMLAQLQMRSHPMADALVAGLEGVTL